MGATPGGSCGRGGDCGRQAPPAGGVGARALDIDGVEKVRGSLAFADDLGVEGMLHAAVLWSAHPHAEILSVDWPLPRVAGRGRGAAAADVPGVNGMGSLVPDQPVLCADRVRFVGDAVALVLAATVEAAREARDLIAVEYRELPGVYSPDEGLASGAPRLHERGNVCKHLVHEVGDVRAALAGAAVVVEGHFETPFVEHAYLEPECALAEPDGAGGSCCTLPRSSPSSSGGSWPPCWPWTSSRCG